MFDFKNVSTPSKFFSKFVTSTGALPCPPRKIRSIASAFEIPPPCFTFHQYGSSVNYHGSHTQEQRTTYSSQLSLFQGGFFACVHTDNFEHRDQQIPLQLEQHKHQSLLFLRLFESLLLQHMLRYLQ